jgi:hypothetical protein
MDRIDPSWENIYPSIIVDNVRPVVSSVDRRWIRNTVEDDASPPSQLSSRKCRGVHRQGECGLDEMIPQSLGFGSALMVSARGPMDEWHNVHHLLDDSRQYIALSKGIVIKYLR